MEQIGIVRSIQEGCATVLVKRTSACGENCAHCKGGCISTSTEAQVINTLDAKVGDVVKIETDTVGVIKAAIILYFLPCLLAIFCAITASVIFCSSYVPVIAATIAFVLSFVVIKQIDKKIAPVSEITKIIGKEDKIEKM